MEQHVADPPLSDTETIRQALAELGGLQTFIGESKNQTKARATAALQQSIFWLRELVPLLSTEAQNEIENSAQEISFAAIQLQSAIQRATPGMRRWLKLDFPPAPKDKEEQGTARLLAELSALKQTCDIAIKRTTGSRKNRVMWFSATESRRLMLSLSTTLPTSSSDNSPYRRLTTLLYNAATGEQRNDLKTTCNEVLQHYNRAFKAELKTLKQRKIVLNLDRQMIERAKCITPEGQEVNHCVLMADRTYKALADKYGRAVRRLTGYTIGADPETQKQLERAPPFFQVFGSKR